VEKTTGLNDTPKNREKVRTWLDRVIEKRDAGKLVFAEAFPGASEEEKATFAKLEGWQYNPEPRDILFGEYLQAWYQNVWSHYPEGTKKNDYRLIIDYWLVPYFGELTFFQISGVEIQKFIASLKWKKGAKKGQPLSKARAKNILIPLRTIWNDACDQYRWVLHNPFTNLRKHLPKTQPKRREGFRYDEWMEFLSHVDPWYHPVVELMILTGMINSEIAGLEKERHPARLPPGAAYHRQRGGTRHSQDGLPDQKDTDHPGDPAAVGHSHPKSHRGAGRHYQDRHDLPACQLP
jgi:integrase